MLKWIKTGPKRVNSIFEGCIRIYCALALAAFALLPATAADQWQQAVGAKIERARQLQAHGHYRESLDYCRALLRNMPDCAAALALCGDAEVALGQADKGLQDFDRAIKLQPGIYEYYKGRAFAYVELKNPRAAIADLNAAQNCKVKPIPGLLANDIRARAELLADQHQYARALADYALAIKTDPGNIDNFTSRGHTYFDMGRYQNAVDDYTLAIKMKPSDLRTFGFRASAYSKLGKKNEADADLKRTNEASLDF